jgi:hypothetical protein
MIRIVERRQDAVPGEKVFELRVFQLHDGDVRAYVVPADMAMNHHMMDEMSEPVAQAYLDAPRAVRARGCHNLVGSRFPQPLSATGSTGAGTVMNLMAIVP